MKSMFRHLAPARARWVLAAVLLAGCSTDPGEGAPNTTTMSKADAAAQVLQQLDRVDRLPRGMRYAKPPLDLDDCTPWSLNQCIGTDGI